MNPVERMVFLCWRNRAESVPPVPAQDTRFEAWLDERY